MRFNLHDNNMEMVTSATWSSSNENDDCFKRSPGCYNWWHTWRFCMCANPVDLLSSQWKLPFYVWLLYRVTIAFTTSILWLMTMIKGDKFKFSTWNYLSDWGFTFVPITLMAEMVALIKYRSYLSSNNTELKCPKPLVILWITSNITINMAVYITVIFWIGTYNRDLTFLSVNIHIMNAVWMVLEQWMHRKPPRWGHFYQPMLVLLIFYIYSCIFYLMGWTDDVGRPYIYYIHDWNYPDVAIRNYFLGVVVLMVVCSLVYGVGRLRGIVAESMK